MLKLRKNGLKAYKAHFSDLSLPRPAREKNQKRNVPVQVSYKGIRESVT
jgi:hypothetical protein